MGARGWWLVPLALTTVAVVGAIAAALLLSQPAAAIDAPIWAPTQQLNRGFIVDGSELAPESSDPRAGIDAQGAALVVWAVPRKPGQFGTDVYGATAPAGQPFRAARLVLANADAPELAVLPDGRALLTATRNDNGPEVLVVGRVDGEFGAVREIGGPRQRVSALAATPQGAVALVVDPTAPVPRTRVLEIGAQGVVGARRDVGLGEFAQRNQVARGADGTLAIAGDSQVVIRSPAGRWRRVKTRLGTSADDPQAGVSPDGRVSVAAIRSREFGEAAVYGGIVVAELQAGANRFGPLRRAPVRPARRPSAFGPVVAYDASGHRVVAWIEDTHPDAGEEQESAFGRAIAWTAAGHRVTLDTKAADVRLLGAANGVLSASDGGPWRTHLLTARHATRLDGPRGSAEPATFGTERGLATSRARTILAWRGRPDGGIRVARLAATP